MRKILAALSMLVVVNASFGAFTVPKPEDKPVVETKLERERAIMEMVTHMSVKDYELLRGKKLNVAEKIAFKITKKRFEKKLKANETEGFNVGGFFLGLLLGLIGVLLAYLFSKDDNFRKWTWIGLGAAVVVYLIFLLL